MIEGGQISGDIHHIQGTGDNIEVAHTEEVKAGSYGAHIDIVKSCEGRPFLSHGDKGVSCEGCNFKHDVQVEGIPGDDHAQKPCNHQDI